MIGDHSVLRASARVFYAMVMVAMVWLWPHAGGAAKNATASHDTVEMGGFQFAKTHRLSNGERVRLYGISKLRYLGLVDVLSSAYYVDNRAATEDPHTMGHRRLEIAYHRDFSAEEFAKATRHLMAENTPKVLHARIRPWIESVCTSYRQVKAGDRYVVEDLGPGGLRVYHNGDHVIQLGDADFAKAYFNIWLGKKPFHEGLRRGLLTPVERERR